jgi:hypothetical protein
LLEETETLLVAEAQEVAVEQDPQEDYQQQDLEDQTLCMVLQ